MSAHHPPVPLLARRAVDALRRQGLTLALAETSTGGTLGGAISDVPGCSAVFLGGIVAYADPPKSALLGVPEALLRQHGAVSEAAALALAEGARRCFQSDLGLATTSIAGPGGGTATKPVGLGFVALAGEGVARCRQGIWTGQRRLHKRAVAATALALLLEHLEALSA